VTKKWKVAKVESDKKVESDQSGKWPKWKVTKKWKVIKVESDQSGK